MKLFMPQRVIFDPPSLEYPLGREIFEFFRNKPVEIIHAKARNTARHISGVTPAQKYNASKRTLLVTTNKSKKLDICKPSADYQFSLVGNCPGSCEYCYLQTTQGAKPYIKVFVNLADIFNVIGDHIKRNGDEATTFEAASLGDPLALEHITGSIAKTIVFFSGLENGKLRVVTKYNNVDSLLNLRHNQNTHFRISINTDYVIDNFEHNTASLAERIEAISKLGKAGYPIGFLIAPIMRHTDWREEYALLLRKLENQLGAELRGKTLTFELIQHRFTTVAKGLILQRFPKTKLDMDEEKRRLKWGRFGRYKYVYQKEQAEEIKQYLTSLITGRFPAADVKYFT
ncbi:MAG: spore photoproduct lyase [bacterium]|jgi:spore photoproduct lyase